VPIQRRIRAPRPGGQVQQISPSLAAQGEKCLLAVIFALDSNYANLRSRGTQFSALGQICHDLWEREGNREFDGVANEDLRDALRAAWDEAEQANVDHLRRSLNGVEPQKPRDWTDYVAKRLGALDLIKRAVLARRASTAAIATSSQRPSVEESINVPGLAIKGRPDRVVWRQGVPHIIDLKTCPADSEMRPEHRRQLLAYAYLWHAQHGDWPATATIQYVGGERHTIDVNPTEADSVAAQMIALLNQVNSDRVTTAPDSFATPSPEACRWCPFKVACAPFFESVTPEWGFYRRQVLGTVESIDPSGETLSIMLTNGAGDIARDISHVALLGVPPDEALRVGDCLAVVGAHATGSPSTLRYSWETVLCVWER
jgi:hypothetical protein